MKALWQCPECGERFVTPNMWHSCGQYELNALFARSQPQVFALYERFVGLVQAIGPVTIIPQKTRVAFQVRVRFVALTPRKAHLQGGFWFTQPHENPLFYKIEKYTPRAYGHHFRINSDTDYDDNFSHWLREAYAVGEQKHLQETV